MPIAYYPTFLRYHLPEPPTSTSCISGGARSRWGRGRRGRPGSCGCCWRWTCWLPRVWVAAPRVVQALGQFIFNLRGRPMTAFALFLIVSAASYLPMHLAFGDVSWLELGRFPLPIQTSRILLYAAYFFVGVGVGAVSLRVGLLAENGELQSAGGCGSPLWCRSTRRSSFWSMPTTIGWISIRRRWRGKSVTASHSRPSAPRWRSRYRRSSCASPAPAGSCSMRCSLQPTASTSCTTFSLSGCNTSSMTIRGRPSSSSRSCSPAHCR